MKRFRRTVMLAAAAIVFGSLAQADDMKGLYGAYQAAVQDGDKREVLKTAEAVHRFAESNYPETSKNRAAALLNYGAALAAVKSEEGEKYLDQALESYRRIYGKDAGELVDPLAELAKAKAGKIKHGRRLRYWRYWDQALEIAAQTHGKDSPLYASLALEAGRNALDVARDRRALRYLEEAQRVYDGPLQHQVYNRFMANMYMGKYYLSGKKYEKAEPLLTVALSLIDKPDSPDSQLELIARAFLVEVYEEMGQTEKSIAQCRAIGRATPFEMDQEPKPLFSRELEYPQRALEIRKEGYAVARFTISDSGFAEDIEILETDGSKSFGPAAVEFLEQARYAPRFVDGEPVDTPDRKMKFSFNLAK